MKAHVFAHMKEQQLSPSVIRLHETQALLILSCFLTPQSMEGEGDIVPCAFKMFV